MIIKKHHSWNLNYKDAAKLQKKFVRKIILYNDINHIKKIAGVDVKFIKNSNSIMGAVLIFSFPDLKLIEAKTCKSKPDFPYIRGIGISKEDLPYIFDRLYQVDKSRSDRGAGLGLSIAKWIADLHKGELKVESKLNYGSKFIIKLPLNI